MVLVRCWVWWLADQVGGEGDGASEFWCDDECSVAAGVESVGDELGSDLVLVAVAGVFDGGEGCEEGSYEGEGGLAGEFVSDG